MKNMCIYLNCGNDNTSVSFSLHFNNSNITLLNVQLCRSWQIASSSITTLSFKWSVRTEFMNHIWKMTGPWKIESSFFFVSWVMPEFYFCDLIISREVPRWETVSLWFPLTAQTNTHPWAETENIWHCRSPSLASATQSWLPWRICHTALKRNYWAA